MAPRLMLVTLMVIFPLALAAQDLFESILHASDGKTYDEFGSSVGMYGDIAIVGAPLADAGAGQAYLFKLVGTDWVETQILTASDSEANARFGTSVAIDGNLAVVGALLDREMGSSAGAVYIFEFSEENGWEESVKLTGTDGIGDGDRYGFSVAIDGTTLAVGAYFSDDFVDNSGAVYVYERVDGVWLLEGRLLSSFPVMGGQFGNALDLDGDYLIVGARSESPDGRDGAGAAYIFARDASQEWGLQAYLTDGLTDIGDHFGYDVAIRNSIAVIGHYQNDTELSGNAGTAHIFEPDTASGLWLQSAMLQASDDDGGDEFGFSVAFDGEQILVGAHFDDEFGEQAGAAYVFKASDGQGWKLDQKVAASDAVLGAEYGTSIAADQGRFIIGARFADCIEAGAGAAYIYLSNPTTRIDETPKPVQAFALQQNYPNPFNPTTTIRYMLATAGDVSLVIHDLSGRMVKQLAIGNRQSAGPYSQVWDGTDGSGRPVASGVYVYRLTVDGPSNPNSAMGLSRKMILVR